MRLFDFDGCLFLLSVLLWQLYVNLQEGHVMYFGGAEDFADGQGVFKSLRAGGKLYPQSGAGGGVPGA